MKKVKLSESDKEAFVRAFAPALVQILRHSGQADAKESDLLAALRDPRSKIEFAAPAKNERAMVACTLTDIHLTEGEVIKTVISRKEG